MALNYCHKIIPGSKAHTFHLVKCNQNGSNQFNLLLFFNKFHLPSHMRIIRFLWNTYIRKPVTRQIKDCNFLLQDTNFLFTSRWTAFIYFITNFFFGFNEKLIIIFLCLSFHMCILHGKCAEYTHLDTYQEIGERVKFCLYEKLNSKLWWAFHVDRVHHVFQVNGKWVIFTNIRWWSCWDVIL